MEAVNELFAEFRGMADFQVSQEILSNAPTDGVLYCPLLRYMLWRIPGLLDWHLVMGRRQVRVGSRCIRLPPELANFIDVYDHGAYVEPAWMR